MTTQLFNGYYRRNKNNSWYILGAGEQDWLEAICPEGAELRLVPTTQEAIDNESRMADASEALLRATGC